MAAAGERRQRENLLGPNRVVNLCYNRRNGMVPAIAIGGLNPRYRDLEHRDLKAIGFEPVYPKGCPSAFKAVDEFTTFTLTDDTEHSSPFIHEMTFAEVDQAAIPRTIVRFVDMFATVYEAIDEAFGDQLPEQYKDLGHPVYHFAVEKELNAGGTSLSMLQKKITPEMLRDMHPIPAEFVVDDDEVLRTMLSGLMHEHPCSIFGSCLKAMMREFNRNIRCCPAPAETSRKPLVDGVPHCLVYGYDTDIPQPRPDGNQRGRPRERCRKILTKIQSDRSRSRSKSPQERIGGDFALGVKHKTRHQEEPILLHDLLRDPLNYCVKADLLVEYLESHIPDISFLQRLEGDDCEVKLVAMISSIARYSRRSFNTFLRSATEQCLWSSLASLQQGQRKIFGLIAVCEGMKAIKVELVNDQWNIFESQLITYQNRADLKSLLFHVFTQSSQDLTQS